MTTDKTEEMVHDEKKKYGSHITCDSIRAYRLWSRETIDTLYFLRFIERCGSCLLAIIHFTFPGKYIIGQSVAI